MQDALAHPLGGRRAWAVWGCAVAVYFLAVFHRSSLGVAGVVAADRFGITSAQLATFTVVQLFVYAAMQIPVGALLDQFGSRVMLVTGVLFMSTAQLAFAAAGTFEAGIAARVLLGMGDAMVFVSVLRLVAFWFPPLRTPMVTQATGWVGQLGGIAAAVPLTAALDGFGWRTTFLLAAGISLLAGVLMFVVVRDSPRSEPPRTAFRVWAVAGTMAAAWREPGTRLGLWTHFTMPFSATVFSMIWGFPWLTVGLGMSDGAAGTVLSLMVIVIVIASPFVATFAGKYPYSRSALVLTVAGVMAFAWAVVLLWPGTPPTTLVVAAALISAVGGPTSMIGFDYARTSNPPERIGSATGIVNVGGFVASLCVVWLMGVVLDHVGEGAGRWTAADFRIAWCVQFLAWGLGVVQILRLRRVVRAGIDSEERFAHLRVRFEPRSTVGRTRRKD